MGESEILRLVGHALYGERWQRPLSRDLNVSDRMLRYWAAGSHASPPDLNGKLLALLKARGLRINEVIALIERKENGED